MDALTQPLPRFSTSAPTSQERAKVEPDYWVADGRRFADLATLGDAVRDGALQVPSDGLHVRQKGWQIERAGELRKQALYMGLGTAAALGGTLALAAAGSVLVIPGMMLTMIGMGLTLGTHGAAHHFATAPQIKDQGFVRAEVPAGGGAPRLVYESLDADQAVEVPSGRP